MLQRAARRNQRSSNIDPPRVPSAKDRDRPRRPASRIEPWQLERDRTCVARSPQAPLHSVAPTILRGSILLLKTSSAERLASGFAAAGRRGESLVLVWERENVRVEAILKSIGVESERLREFHLPRTPSADRGAEVSNSC